ncbi:MAG: sodium/solute symporter [Eubacterium sp.]|nr:sodium/solute symporter [Eubacterium sp.]
MVIKLILLIVFFAVMIGIGFYTRKHATDVGGFVLGGRSVGPWLTAFAYGTSYFSAVVFVGYAGQFGYKYGIASTWIGIGNALLGSLIAWVVLGRRTRIMTKHLNSMTMPDFFGKRYDSGALRVAASIIAFVFLIPYTASVYNGLSNLFEMAFDIPYQVCVIVMAVLTGVYVIAGGYMATALNDLVQGIIMLIGIVVVIGAVLSGHGGFIAAIKELAAVPSDVMPGAYASFFGPDPLNLLGVVILTSLGTWGLPQMIQKFYAIKDEKSVQTGTIISTIFAIVVAGGCYFLGGFSQISGIEAAADGTVKYDAIIPTMLSSLPDILIGIVIVLVLSASMSTLSSLVLTSSSTLTLDFIKPLFAKNMGEKKQLLCMRIFLAGFIIISVIIALDPPGFIAQLMGISWGALAGAFLAPFLYGLYSKRVTGAAVWASFIAGVGITVSNMIYPYIGSPINAGAIAMIAGLVVMPVVSLFTPKLKKEIVDDAFSCLEEDVVVKRRVALPKDE